MRQYRYLGPGMENTRRTGSQVKTRLPERIQDMLSTKMSPSLHSLLKTAEVADLITLLIACFIADTETTDPRSPFWSGGSELHHHLAYTVEAENCSQSTQLEKKVT